MVKADCESSGNPIFLELLYSAHQKAKSILGQDPNSNLIQFSDSIVFSKPYAVSDFESFVSTVAIWQRELLISGLLCRGGITFGKHFVDDKFLFSKAMIDAYHLESQQARYPRILISKDLLELVSPKVELGNIPLINEDDGVCFVDYIDRGAEISAVDLTNAVTRILEKTKSSSPSVQEKLRWLARYADHKLQTTLSRPTYSAL